MKFLLLLSVLATTVRAEEVVVRDANGWSFKLPAGFERMRKAEGAMLTRVFVFHPGAADFAVVGTQIINGRIDKRCVSADDMAKAKNAPEGFQSSRVKWRTHELCVMRMLKKQGELTLVSISAEVPLTPKGLNLHVSGHVANEAALRALLEKTVATLEGETYWK